MGRNTWNSDKNILIRRKKVEKVRKRRKTGEGAEKRVHAKKICGADAQQRKNVRMRRNILRTSVKMFKIGRNYVEQGEKNYHLQKTRGVLTQTQKNAGMRRKYEEQVRKRRETSGCAENAWIRCANAEKRDIWYVVL